MMRKKPFLLCASCAIVMAAIPSIGLSKAYYCSYTQKCEASDLANKSCVSDNLEASVSGIENKIPQIFALEASFDVSKVTVSEDGKYTTYSGSPDNGGYEAVTIHTADLASSYRQKFTLDDGLLVDVRYLGQCELEE